MTLALPVALIVLSGLCAIECSASEGCFPIDPKLVEVTSVNALPSETGSALGALNAGLEGIADRGQRFNITDVVNSSLPMRRFSKAGVSTHCVLVAVERGGRGYSVEVSMFERKSNAWNRKLIGTLDSPPSSLSDLVIRATKLQQNRGA